MKTREPPHKRYKSMQNHHTRYKTMLIYPSITKYSKKHANSITRLIRIPIPSIPIRKPIPGSIPSTALTPRVINIKLLIIGRSTMPIFPINSSRIIIFIRKREFLIRILIRRIILRYGPHHVSKRITTLGNEIVELAQVRTHHSSPRPHYPIPPLRPRRNAPSIPRPRL